jgi:hypothetical protein
VTLSVWNTAPWSRARGEWAPGHDPDPPILMEAEQDWWRRYAPYYSPPAQITPASITAAGKTAYYVDSASGSDANNGTSTATPWQTIGKVNGSTFNAGDGIFFRAGQTFGDAVLSPPSSGSSGSPVVFGGYGVDSGLSNRPILDQGVLVPLGRVYVTFDSLRSKNILGASSGTAKNMIVAQNCKLGGYGTEYGHECSNALDTNWQFKHCEVTDTRDSGLINWGDGFLVEGCYVHDVGTQWASYAFGLHGIYSKGPNTVVQYTEVSNVLDPDGAACTMRYRASLIQGCYLHEASQGIEFYNYDPAATGAGRLSTWRYNRIRNCQNGILIARDGDTSSATAGMPEDFAIYNNTIETALRAGAGSTYSTALRYYNDSTTTGHRHGTILRVHNNIWQIGKAVSNYAIVDIKDNPALGAGWTMGNNLLRDVTFGFYAERNGTGQSTLANWQTATSRESGSIGTDPLLDGDADTAWQGSPVVDAGTTSITGVTFTAGTDGAPLHYDGSAPDIGATEQYTPSAAVARALTFASTGTGTDSFALSAKRALTFTSTGSGTDSFALGVRRKLTFSSTGTGTSTFALGAKRVLTFASTGTGTDSFALTAKRTLAFTSTGAGTDSFALTAKRALTFSSTGTGTSSFTLGHHVPLTFASTGTGTSTFTLTAKRKLTFVSLGIGTSSFGVQPTSYSAEVLADTPAGYWRMNESGATNFVDSSGNARTLTKVAGGWPAIGGLLDGDANGAAQLPAAGGNSDASRASTGLVGNPLTVEFWIEFAMPPAGGILMSVSNGSNGYWMGADMTSGGRWLWQLPGVGGAGLFVSPIEVAKRYHVVFVQPAAGGVVSLYLNGQFVQSITCGSMLTSSALFKINGWDFASGAGMVATKGTVLDEVAIYGSALSASRILAHYNAGATGRLSAKRALTFSSTGTGTDSFALTAVTPTGGPKALTFSSTGTGTSSFALTAKRALAFSSTGTGTSSFALGARRQLTFASSGTGTDSFALGAKRKLTFASTGTGTSTWAITARRALTFASTGTGTTSFTLTAKRRLTFTSTGVGTSTFGFANAAATIKPLTFASTGSGTSAFALRAIRKLTFASTGTGTSAFALRAIRAFAFASAGVGTSTFALGRRRPLSFASSGVGTSAFGLARRRPLAFTSAGVGTSTFVLARPPVARALTFASAGSGTTSFTLKAKRRLAFVSAGVGTSSFALTRIALVIKGEIVVTIRHGCFLDATVYGNVTLLVGIREAATISADVTLDEPLGTTVDQDGNVHAGVH